MGSCISKRGIIRPKRIVRIVPSLPDPELPEFYYLDRKSKEILHHNTDGTVQNFRLNTTINFYSDSAICNLSKTRVMMAGGSKLGNFTKNVYTVDFASKELIALQKLPIPTKDGTLIKYNSRVYFIGGIILFKNDDESESFIEKTAPFMLLNLEDNRWKYLICDDGNQSDGDFADCFPEFPLENLILPGAFLWKDRIYIVGGYRINEHGNAPNANVYSLDLNDNSLRKENYKFDINAIQPLCNVDRNEITIISRYSAENGRPSNQCWRVIMREDGPVMQSLNPINFEFAEHYPNYQATNATVFLSYPYFSIKYLYGRYAWKTFLFERIVITKSLDQPHKNQNIKKKYQKLEREATGRTEILSSRNESLNPARMPEIQAAPALYLIEVDCKKFHRKKPESPKNNENIAEKEALLKEITNLLAQRQSESEEESQSKDGYSESEEESRSDENSDEEESESGEESERSGSSSYSH